MRRNINTVRAERNEMRDEMNHVTVRLDMNNTRGDEKPPVC